MTVFWLNLAFVYAFAFLARYYAQPAPLYSTVRANPFFTFLAATMLILVAGFQSGVGDTVFYLQSYETRMFDWAYISAHKDIGFGVYQMLLQRISSDGQLLIFTTALITNALIVWTLYKYSRMLEVSLYVYITSGMFVVSMNGIRQFLAAAIIFAATTYIVKGNWKMYFVVIIFASTIHQSTLILLPIYFLVRTRAWSKMTFVLLGMAVVIALGFDQLSSVLFSAIENTQYGEYKNFKEGGANVIRVIVQSIPLGFAYIGRERLRELFPQSDIIVNMALIGFMFMVISTQNWIFARFSIYFGLYQIVLMGWVILVFVENNRRLIYYGIFVFYFLYHYYEQVIALNMHYYSRYFEL